ncbi:target of Nesh-SH3 isoform 6-T6 [Leptodactylus fuscus]|uniref:target of Nesh-SH3 isoform X6 n=1 Tax=Leptodactylus fuscus TaxID=238119 RepID=UPI003F4EE7AC
MISRLLVLLFCGIILADLGDAQKLPKVKKLNMKAHINITGDTLMMKFHRPNQNIKLEGFILGYGSNYFTNQYIPWPENGMPYITDVDAETRYLIAVKPNDNPKKSCKEKNSIQKPLQLVIGTLTPTSVFLSWGILINPQVDWSALNKCPNDRFYTVRYREKNKDWNFQLCPTTETVIDNLKPNTLYEFGVKDNSDDEIWSKPHTHKTIPKGKENGNIENTYKIPKGTLQYATEDTKAFIPVTKVKQGFQNITKSTPAPPPTGKSPVHRGEIKKPYVATTTTRIATPKPKPVSKITEPPPVFKPSEKPAVEEPKPVASQPIVDSFTPDSSTGTLEWVRGTMVTHPFLQVTNIPVESSATEEHTTSLVIVRESDGIQDESAGIATLEPVLTVDPPRDILVSPTIEPFPFSKQHPSQEPETVLANEKVSTYIHEDRTVPQIISVLEKPISTDAPQLSSYMSPELQKTTLAETPAVSLQSTVLPLRIYRTTSEVPSVATDVPQVSPFFPVKKYMTTLAADKKHPIYVPTKLSTLEKSQTHYATTRQNIPTKKSSLPSHIQTKTTTASVTQILPSKQRTRPPRTRTKTTTAFRGSQHVLTTYESIARTEVPHSVHATTTQIMPATQRTLPFHPRIKATTAFTGGQHIPTTYESNDRTEVPHSVHVTASQIFSAKQSTMPTHIHTKTNTAFTEDQNTPTQDSIVRTEAPYYILVPNETVSLHTKPFPSTEAPSDEADSTQPDSEVKTTEAPHTSEAEIFTLASKKTRAPPVQHKTPLPQKTYPTAVLKDLPSTQLPEETTTSTVPTETHKYIVKKAQTTKSPSISLAPKKTRAPPVQDKTPLPQKTYPTAVLKDLPPTQLPEETTTSTVPTETHKYIVKKAQTTESPSLSVDPKKTHILPIDDFGVDILEHTKITLEPNKTEQPSSPKFSRTTKSPTISTAVKPVPNKRMPINLISLHIFADPTIPSEKTETQTTLPPIPKTTQSNKILHSKPAPKSTQRMPINVISLQIFEEPDVPLVSNTTQRPFQSTTTQKPESPPHSKPVPTQKVSTPIIKKPKPTPRTHAKPVTTGAPKNTTKPKHPHVIHPTTLAPYRLQHSSTRPKTSLRPRTRPPAHNGTTQGPIRSRPTGEFNWIPGTIPGGKVFDSTKILGVSRNTSMESNNTGKRTFSVSSPPLPPVKPTSIRRRNQASNVTGRPGVSVSSPPLLPVRPTSVRRKPQTTNVTGRPGNQGDNLIPRAPSATKPDCAIVCIKSPMKQPTLPSQEEDMVLSTVFSPSPKSDTDPLGKPRYIAPHVVYMSKNESVPCSITETLQHFPTDEENPNQEATTPPQNPPANLTVVTVEGCSSFVVLNWEKPDNDTVTEYDVISKENGGPPGKDQSIITTNQTHSTVENLKPDTSYEFQVIPKNPLGEGPSSATVEFNTESADPRVSEQASGGKDAIWTEIKFKSDSYSECKGKQYVKRTWYKKFVGIQLCNSLRYKIYLSDTLSGTFYNIGDQSGFGEDHCQFVDSFLEGRTGQQIQPNELEPKKGFYRAVRQQPVDFGEIGGQSHISYVHWYECGISIPGKW